MNDKYNDAMAGRDSLHSLIDRLGMINRIHAALRSTLNIQDIYSIILTTMISRSGFHFSRAMLLGMDEARGELKGLSALGAISREENLRLHAEVAQEEQALASMVRDLHQLQTSADEEKLFRQSLSELSSHSFWITTYQKFSLSNQLMDDLQEESIPWSHEAEGPTPPWLRSLAHPGRDAVIVSKENLVQSTLPQGFKDLVGGESLWAAVKIQDQLRLVLIADKRFVDEPLSEMDVVHVEWFAGQVALALENAEMFLRQQETLNQVMELDHMKSNFLATISHELRTPLTAINGYVQLMLGHKLGALSPGQKEILERIHAHSELLTGKVNDLIEIAELDSNRQVAYSLCSVDPLNALMSVLPRVEQRRVQKAMTIEPEVTCPIPAIYTNPESLGRILFHLVDNAIKFGNPAGMVRITFEPRPKEQALAISVIDDGIGISEAKLSKIFDAFYQVDNHLTRSYEGLGIGLAIIKKQLEMTGGRIDVGSQPGLGSRFTIIYPLAQGDAPVEKLPS